MLRLHVTVLLSLFSLPALASEPTDSTASRPIEKAEVVIVHFGDSTCITSYLPKEQRVEAVLNDRLSAFYENQRIVSHNVAAGGDYIRQFLDSGRYKKAVKDRIPHIDIALIRYGHNDQKHCEPVDFQRHLEELCDLLVTDYPGVQIVLETNTWVDPKPPAADPESRLPR